MTPPMRARIKEFGAAVAIIGLFILAGADYTPLFS